MLKHGGFSTITNPISVLGPAVKTNRAGICCVIQTIIALMAPFSVHHCPSEPVDRNETTISTRQLVAYLELGCFQELPARCSDLRSLVRDNSNSSAGFTSSLKHFEAVGSMRGSVAVIPFLIGRPDRQQGRRGRLMLTVTAIAMNTLKSCINPIQLLRK